MVSWRVEAPDLASYSASSILEQELQCELHQSGRSGLQNLSECGRFQVILRQSQIRMIEQIEALRPELYTLGLAELEILE